MKAVIFDMDGVIVDSELQWQLAEGEFFRRLVPLWREEDHHKIVGLGVEDLYHWLVKEYSLTASKRYFLKECQTIAEQVYGERVTLTPGFKEVAEGLKRQRVMVGLASSSPKAWIDQTLNRFGLAPLFDARACADDVPSGKTKPEPDIYLKCLERLGAQAATALAVEDSVLGLTAAKRAGLMCAGFRNGSNDAQDLSKADFEFRSFAELQDYLRAHV